MYEILFWIACVVIFCLAIFTHAFWQSIKEIMAEDIPEMMREAHDEGVQRGIRICVEADHQPIRSGGSLQHNDPDNCSHKYDIAGHYTGSNGKKMVTWKCRNCPASYDREEM